MRPTSIFIFLFLLIPHYLSHASNNLSDYQHKTRMSLCNMDHIQIIIFPPLDIKRESIEENEKYCRGVKLESDNVEYVRCFILKEPSYSKEIKEHLGKNIKYLYASLIADLVGVKTTDNPPSNSFLGLLNIKVEYRNGTRSDGSIWYTVNQYAELQEQALSRSGREGYMSLERWSDVDGADGIANADMVALNLVTKVVNKMRKTFQEAREYCTKYNLIQQ